MALVSRAPQLAFSIESFWQGPSCPHELHDMYIADECGELDLGRGNGT